MKYKNVNIMIEIDVTRCKYLKINALLLFILKIMPTFAGQICK